MNVRLPCLALLAAACATGAARRPERPPETSSERALPEPDPVCRGTVQQHLLAHGLEQITVELAIAPSGKVTVLDVLAPELDPAGAAELRAACAGCAWTPGLKVNREQRARVVIEAPPEPAAVPR